MVRVHVPLQVYSKQLEQCLYILRMVSGEEEEEEEEEGEIKRMKVKDYLDYVLFSFLSLSISFPVVLYARDCSCITCRRTCISKSMIWHMQSNRANRETNTYTCRWIDEWMDRETDRYM